MKEIIHTEVLILGCLKPEMVSILIRLLNLILFLEMAMFQYLCLKMGVEFIMK